MKIAIFTETYLPYINGVVTHIKSLKDGLERAGHTVLVVTADPGVKHHHIKDGVLWCPAKKSKRFYDYGLASPVSIKRKKMIKEFNPDILHIHQEFCVGFSGLHISKSLKVPLVYTLHTMYDDYLYYVVPKPFIPALRRISHRYFKMFGKRAAAITGPSKKVTEFLNECGVHKDVHVIPNPVELDKFSADNINPERVKEIKAQYQVKDDVMNVCFCGRLGKEKSVDVMLQYFAETVKPEDKIHLYIFGDGPSRPELEALAKELQVEHLVTFTGKVAHDDLLHFYSFCELYITTSLSDTNSISMLEAMAVGLPVLHIKDELNEGQVKHGINGFIFEDAQGLHRLMKDYQQFTPQQKESLKQSVLESVKKSGQEALAQNLLAIYNHLYEDKKNSRLQ